MKWTGFLLFVVIMVIIPLPQARSQDNVIYRQHFLHPHTLNPAITGSEFIPTACLTYHKQWVGIEGSPQTMIASAAMRVGNFDFYNPKMLIHKSKLKSRERIGLGFSVYSDRNGPALDRGLNIAYAYHLSLEEARLSMGLSGSARQKIVDESLLRPTNAGDPVLSNVRESFIMYNASAGIYYYSAEFFGGMAVHHLIPLDDPFRSGERIKPDMMLHGGYLFSSLGRPQMEISSTVRFLDTEKLEFDINFRPYIREVHWVALSYRSYNALALHLGIEIGGIYMVYSYEANLSGMVKYNLGSHALHLGLHLGKKSIRGF